MFWILLVVGVAAILVGLFVNLPELLGNGLVGLGCVIGAVGLIGSAVCFTMYSLNKTDMVAEMEIREEANQSNLNNLKLHVITLQIEDKSSIENCLTSSELAPMLLYVPELKDDKYVQDIARDIQINNSELQDLRLKSKKFRKYKPWILMQ